MKKRVVKILSITVFCFLASYLCALAGGLSKGAETYPVQVAKKYSNEMKGKATPVEMHRTFSLDKVNQIDVVTTSKDVVFNIVEKDILEVIYKSDISFPGFDPEKDISTIIDGNQLIVKTDERKMEKSLLNFSASLGKDHGKIIVNMPRKITQLALKTVSGNIAIPATTFEQVKIETVSGDISLNQTKIAKADIFTVSGDLQSTGSMDQFHGKTVSGDMEIEVGTDAPDVTLETTSGDMNLAFTQKPSVTVDFSSLSGTVNVDQSFGGVTAASKSAKFTLGAGKGSVHVKTVSGDVTIAKKYN